LEPRFTVKIYLKPEPFKIKKEIQVSLKGVLGPKKIKAMKFEAVDCPVLKSEVPFLQCFVCPNHLRRFKGEVHCEGNAL